MEKLHLTAEKIYDKQFNVDFKGYSPIEVDEFLDLIMKDYEMFEQVVSSLQEQVVHYEQLISDLSSNNQTLQGKLSAAQNKMSEEGSFVDLIRRVARLEETVFND